MTRNQAEWAAEHDWCIDTFQTSGGAWVVHTRVDTGDQPDVILADGTPVMHFSSLTALRAWAGY